MIENAKRNNIVHLLSNSTDYESSTKTAALARHYPGIVLAAVGVHPWTATNSDNYQLEKFEELIQENADAVKAIGEIGLDGKYTQDEALRSRQREVFRFFLALAERRKLPVIVHSRQAVDQVLAELAEFDVPKVLLHWYDGPEEKLSLIQARGYFVSFGPAIFYSRRLTEISKKTSLDMILSETDGPVRYRDIFEGKLMEPSFVLNVVAKLAEIRVQGVKEIREAVLSNFHQLIPGTA